MLAFVERRRRPLLAALVLLASIRIAATYTVFNHTFDEPVHIACGMEWLDKGIYHWEAQHPPLSRVAVALGPWLAGARSQNTPDKDEFSKTREGLNILYRSGNYDRTLALARLGTLPFFWAACAVVYIWGRRYFGRAIAVIAVALFTFLPPVLAHAGMATTDMALTAFFSASFLSGILWMERPSPKTAAVFGAMTGLAILSKFSTFAFLPVCFAVALAWFWYSERPSGAAVGKAIRSRAPGFALAAGVACALIWAGYRFSFDGVPAPELFRGIREVAQHNALGHPEYLLGRTSMTGFWYFYPVVLTFKTPIGFLLLFGAGIPAVLRHRRGWLLFAFAAGILLVGAFSRINIGVRHVLPVYVAFSIAAAAGIARLLETAGNRRWIPGAVGAACLWFAASSVLSHPDYLPYFNELAGSTPERIAVDSDLDWGQDVKRLAARLKQAGAHEVTFANQMLADFQTQHGMPPMIERMDVTQPNPGWNAVSLTFLKSRRLGLFGRYPEVVLWPNRIPIQERVGKGILLWYFPPR